MKIIPLEKVKLKEMSAADILNEITCLKKLLKIS